ncbi:sigma-70 family RNA polymerase sigma factor [uncultured Roseovarius sp.]|uniref:sigma-70 family RNA polymerase sigma factor n=1 Tax=uncultured Roseovarius sp. TaxID=293344 RepID=UPI0025917735|nr:sigma-70 family RNA polymerase sigma factor [uncultured Roseovarius sp.]
MQKSYAPSAPSRPGYNDRTGFLTAEEELRLARAWRDDGNVEARNRLITAYHPLVMSIARRFTKNRNINDDPDLLQHGLIGLLKAADGFDPDRGFRFSTYAAWWVRAELQDYRMNNWSLVKRGRSSKARKAFFNLARIEETLEAVPGETTPEREQRIADKLGVKASELDGMRQQFSGSDSSLNRLTAGEEGDEIINLLPDPDCDVEEQVATRHDMDVFRRTVSRHFGHLPDRERDIVIATVVQDPPMTLHQLGEIHGISRERVRQLRERGLERLRDSLRAEPEPMDMAF